MLIVEPRTRPFAGVLSLRDAVTIALENHHAVFVDVRPDGPAVLDPSRVVSIPWTGDEDGFIARLRAAVPDHLTPVMMVGERGTDSEPAARAAFRAGYRRSMNVADGLESREVAGCS